MLLVKLCIGEDASGALALPVIMHIEVSSGEPTNRTRYGSHPTNYKRWDPLATLAKFQDIQPLVAQVLGAEPCSIELRSILLAKEANLMVAGKRAIASASSPCFESKAMLQLYILFCGDVVYMAWHKDRCIRCRHLGHREWQPASGFPPMPPVSACLLLNLASLLYFLFSFFYISFI